MRTSQIAAMGVILTFLGAAVALMGVSHNDINAVIIGAITAATGLIITILASLIESIQLGVAAIVGATASKDFKGAIDKLVKDHKKKMKEQNDD